MKIILDDKQFDIRQHKLMELIIKTIIEEAKPYMSNESDLAQLTDDIAFSIGAMLDGSTVMEVNDKPLKPFLTFSLDEDNTTLIGSEDGSWMHEYVMGWADDLIMGESDNQFISSIRISLGVGIKHKSIIYRDHLDSEEELTEIIEYMLNIRQTGKTFEEVTTRRKEIQSIAFSDKENPHDDEWNENTFTKGKTGDYEYSAQGIAQFIINKLSQ